MLNPAIQHFLDTQRLETPFLVMDLEVVRANYSAFRSHMPDANVFYAVKANPVPEVICALAKLGSGFDVASPREIELCLSLNILPSRMSYGNTIKKAKDIVFAYRCGVRTFAFDSLGELEKLAEHAPGSRVICRLLTSSEGAEWPLSHKFGCDLEMAYHLLRLARELELEAYGVSFHVGSQQLNPHAWDDPIQGVAQLFTRLEEAGVHLKAVNLGGGFPASLGANVPDLCSYASAINAALQTHLGNFKPNVMLEPGRGLVGNAGLIQTEVVLISRKSQSDPASWVYLDVGKFGGLIETMDEAIKYPIHSTRGGDCQTVILAGPTCDSADILYERHPIKLPITLEVGDRLEILGAGAYTASYAAVNFNGFAPLKTHWIDGSQTSGANKRTQPHTARTMV
jgi:ornithine decarboxylase